MSKISDEFERRHRKNLQDYKNRIESIYHAAIEKISRTAAGSALPSGVFSLSRLPILNGRVNEVLGEMRVNIRTTIVNGIIDQWQLSNQKNDQYVDKRLSNELKANPKSSIFYDPNLEARNAFIKRKVKGLNLSDNVWKHVKSYRKELEAALGVAISKGQSATAMSTDLKQYLNDPDKLFRRVRDSKGNLQLSAAARKFNPGRGVYRSSFKNILRLGGTETNMANRTADHVRWKGLPFVVGQEIRLSLNHPRYDVCDRCAGKYPKEFVFIGWHPQCICYKVPIMMSDKEYDQWEADLIEGKSPRVRSENKVTDVPPGFKDFLNDQSDRINGWASKPYWVRDNFKNGNINEPLKFKTVSATIPEAFSMTPAVLDRMRATDVLFQNEGAIVQQLNTNMKGFNLEQLFKDFDALGEQHGIEWTAKRVVGSNSTNGTFLTTRHIGKTSEGEVYIERNFKLVGGKTEVYHAYFQIPKHLQGGGISKQVLGSYYEQYKNAGISKVKVTANIDVGGYTWGKYGFAATDPYAVVSILEDKAYLLTEPQKSAVYKILRNHLEKYPGKPFPMRRIADLGKLDGSNYGKKILLGTYWSGELNLLDKATMFTFEDYLYGKKKK